MLCWAKTVHVTWAILDRSGVRDMKCRLRETREEADSRREKIRNAWMENGTERDGSLGEREKRIKASWHSCSGVEVEMGLDRSRWRCTAWLLCS